MDAVLAKVDPFIGTGFHGHTFPGATTPFGMVQLSPDTRTSGWDACGGYYDADTEIWGFSHTHLSGTGIGDYGDVLMMPFTGEVSIGSGTPEKPDYGYRSAFDKKNQFATPGYYRVLLDRYQIKAELSATPRVGVHRYTFPKADKAGVVIDLKHSIQNRQTLEAEIEVINDHEIAGWRHMRGWAPNRWIHFHAEFSKPFTAELFEGDVLKQGPDLRHRQERQGAAELCDGGRRDGAGQSRHQPGGLRRREEEPDGGSARMGFRSEWCQQAAAAWAKQLNRIQVKGGTPEQQKIFSTALYHSSICPNIASDVDGRYRGMDQKIHQDAGLHQLHRVLAVGHLPRATSALHHHRSGADQAWIRALLRKHEQGGILPMWDLAVQLHRLHDRLSRRAGDCGCLRQGPARLRHRNWPWRPSCSHRNTTTRSPFPTTPTR